jgi:hypothetical protein
MIRGVTIFNSLLPVGSINLEAVLRARDDRAIPTFVLCTFIGPLMLGP